MNRFLSKLLNYDLVDDLAALALDQANALHDQQRIIDSMMRENSRLKLEYTRWGRSVIEEFLIALDQPEYEEDLRRRLAEALSDLHDEVARIEEHAPV